MLVLPVSVEAEYRGQAPASQFQDRTTGEVVDLAPMLKFEYEDDGGDVAIIPVRLNQADEAADFNAGDLDKGDRVHLTGKVTVADRNSGRQSYFRLDSLRRLSAEVKTPVRAAS